MLIRFMRALRRYRLRMAECDLMFLEAKAPVTIAEQAARVERLRAKVKSDDVRSGGRNSQAVIKRAELAAKRQWMDAA